MRTRSIKKRRKLPQRDVDLTFFDVDLTFFDVDLTFCTRQWNLIFHGIKELFYLKKRKLSWYVYPFLLKRINRRFLIIISLWNAMLLPKLYYKDRFPRDDECLCDVWWSLGSVDSEYWVKYPSQLIVWHWCCYCCFLLTLKLTVKLIAPRVSGGCPFLSMRN